MKTFYEWYIETTKERGQIVPQNIGTRLFQLGKNYINENIKRGNLEELRYENNSFVVLKDLERFLMNQKLKKKKTKKEKSQNQENIK